LELGLGTTEVGSNFLRLWVWSTAVPDSGWIRTGWFKLES
jgi:hypothetical protein